MHKTIKTIEKWCKTKELSISALKTQIVMFNWNRNWTLRPITVGNNIIGLFKSAKFLGVTLDSKLNFNEHIINSQYHKKCYGNGHPLCNDEELSVIIVYGSGPPKQTTIRGSSDVFRHWHSE